MSLTDKIQEGNAIITLKNGYNIEKNERIIQISRSKYKVYILPQSDGENLMIYNLGKDRKYCSKKIPLDKIKNIKNQKQRWQT